MLPSLVLAAIAVLAGAEGRASEDCARALVSSLLPRTREIPLDEGTASLARRIFGELKTFSDPAFADGGSNVLFVIGPESEFFGGHETHESAYHISGYMKGETEQGAFLARLILAALPQASFHYLPTPVPKTPKHKIRIFVQDHGEALNTTVDKMEMQELKPANSSAFAVSSESVRAQIGIPKGTRVVSLYGVDHVPEVRSLENPANVIRAYGWMMRALARSNADLIFVSHWGLDEKGIQEATGFGFLDHPLIQRHFVTKRLSDLKAGELSSLLTEALAAGRKVVIENDTKGLVSTLASASDVFVVNLEEAINAFEGANAGTPTIVLTPKYRKGEVDHTEILTLLRDVPDVFVLDDVLVSRDRIGSSPSKRRGFIGLLDAALDEHRRIELSDRPAVGPITSSGASPLERAIRNLGSHIRRSASQGWSDWEQL